MYRLANYLAKAYHRPKCFLYSQLRVIVSEVVTYSFLGLIIYARICHHLPAKKSCRAGMFTDFPVTGCNVTSKLNGKHTVLNLVGKNKFGPSNQPAKGQLGQIINICPVGAVFVAPSFPYAYDHPFHKSLLVYHLEICAEFSNKQTCLLGNWSQLLPGKPMQCLVYLPDWQSQLGNCIDQFVHNRN